MDTRQKAGASVLETDEAISSICVLPNGTVLSGDAKGVLNMWDIRKGKTVDRQVVGGPNAAVAHIAGLAGKHGSSAGGRYLAINSHDNIVRLCVALRLWLQTVSPNGTCKPGMTVADSPSNGPFSSMPQPPDTPPRIGRFGVLFGGQRTSRTSIAPKTPSDRFRTGGLPPTPFHNCCLPLGAQMEMFVL